MLLIMSLCNTSWGGGGGGVADGRICRSSACPSAGLLFWDRVELSLTHGCGAECRLFSHCLVCVSNRNIFGASGIRPTLIVSWSRT